MKFWIYLNFCMLIVTQKYLVMLLVLLVRMCAYQGVRNVRFSENLGCFVFLKHPFWDSPFYLITDELWKNVLDKEDVGAMTMELSKAFDTIHYDLIIFKLRGHDFSRDTLVQYMRSYFADREQRVPVNSKFSTWKNIIARVPPSAMLWSLLFNILWIFF